MTLPIQITYRDMEPSPWIEARIHEEAAKLERYFDRITSCRVMVEVPHHHHQRGNQVHVRIDLGVPGSELVVNHEPSQHGELVQGATASWEKHFEVNPQHKDAYLAIHDSFKQAKRQLQSYAERLRGNVKLHNRMPPTREEKLS